MAGVALCRLLFVGLFFVGRRRLRVGPGFRRSIGAALMPEGCFDAASRLGRGGLRVPGVFLGAGFVGCAAGRLRVGEASLGAQGIILRLAWLLRLLAFVSHSTPPARSLALP
jgi:hypothetical protein